MVIGRAPNEPTGDDRSWVALSLNKPRSRRAILAAAKALQPDAHLCLDRTSKSREWLLDVAGFASEVEGAIAALGEALGAEARVLGSYAVPLPAAALADRFESLRSSRLNDMSLKVRPGILDIAAYVPGDHSLPGEGPVYRMASNESALGPSPKAIEAYRALAAELHRYPDGASKSLRAGLGRTYGIEPDQIVCGAGSDDVLQLLVRAYAGPGDEVLYTQHGFLVYPIAAKAVGATPVAAPETDLRTDVDALLKAVTPRTRICFVANPNNPTGSYVSSAELKRLRAGLPEQRAAGGRRGLCRVCRSARL